MLMTYALDHKSYEDIVLQLTPSNDTAVAGVDYSPIVQVSTDAGLSWNTSSVVSIAAGTATILARVPIIDDDVYEPSKCFTVTATRTSGTTSNLNCTSTITIIDNDPVPTLSVNNITVDVANTTDAIFDVVLSGKSSTDTTFQLATQSVTAVLGTHYGNVISVSTDNGATWKTQNTLTIPATMTQAKVKIPVLVSSVSGTDTNTPTDIRFNLVATKLTGYTSNTSSIGTCTVIEHTQSL